MTTALPWAHQSVDIPAGGLSQTRTADAAQRAALAKDLGMLDLTDLTARYRIDALAGGGYRLHGRVQAAGAQPCVVSLEPVPAKLDEAFDVEFWAERRDADDEPEGGEAPILDARDVEVLERGEIPVGRIVFETLSAGLDPYPRKPDATFEWQDQAARSAEKASPFAVLSKLKRDT